MKTIATIEGVPIIEHEDGRVEFTAKGAICADGANGQNGKPAAYMRGNAGTDYLANGGMGIDKNGNVVIAQAWARNIIILNPATGQPREWPGGIIASKTAYRFPMKPVDDRSAYVDAETVPYIVVPPAIIRGVKGVVLGCRGRITNKANGKSVEAVVAEVGPRTKLGELSIAAARAIGIPSSPKTGGVTARQLHYELWPGKAAPGFSLQPS